MNIERISLDQLRVLVATVNEGSFSAAARKLGRVQSAVTYTVQQLELQLGIELFDRTGYRPVLTAAGASLIEDARAVLTRADGLLAKAGAIAAGLESSLSITVDVMVPVDWLAQVLEEFDARFPGVQVQLQIEALG
ncbi:MAG: LysR family transcriptional regulator, partial [Hydrogenophaga sp.]|nr:LysR family transcriptional regulator [Hydrogenophaga sp.]